MELTTEFWQNVALQMNRANNARPVVESIIDRYGLGRNTVYRQAARHGYQSGRKRRADAGMVDEEMMDHLWQIFHIYHRKSRINGAESRMPLERAMEIYLDTFPPDRRPELLSPSRVHQIIRRMEVSRKDARKATPKIELRTLYPNHLHEYDTSICRYYIAPDKKIIWIPRAQDYQNKPGRFDKKQRLIRHIMIDHCTGAFFVEYSTTQQTLDVAEFFFHAWERKEDNDFIFHGVPYIFVTDNDTALKSYAVRRLLSYLEVEYPDITPYHAWVKGVVEQFHLTWERWFEMGFLFQKSGDLGEINRWAYEYAIRFQKTRRHTRHNMTRFAAWDRGIRGKLREIPDYHTYMKLLHSRPVTRDVKSDGKFRYKNVRYELKNIYSTKVDVIIHPYLYEQTGAVTVQYPSRELNPANFDPKKVKIQTMTVLPIEKDRNGFNKAAVVAGTYRALKKTGGERNFDQVAETELTRDIKPFDGNREKAAEITFLNRLGTVIKAGSEVDFKAIEYTITKAKFEIVGRLGRGLSEWENQYISENYQEKISGDEIEKLADFFRQETNRIKKEA